MLFARFGRFDGNDTDCLVDVANEWFDAIDLIPEGCGGGLLTHFYSHNEHELGGEGLLFSIGIFEQEYDYSWKPWASQAKCLTTYTDSTGSKYDLKSSTAPLLRLYLGVYAVCRFILEFYRGDALRGLWLGLSTSQWVSLAILGYLIVSILCKKEKPAAKTRPV